MFENYKLLPYFIHEELFLLPQDRQLSSNQGSAAALSAEKQPESTAAGTERKAIPPVDRPLKKAAPAAEQVSPGTASPASGAKSGVNPHLIFGKNKKNLLILVEDHQNVVMERADGLLLKDILKALDFTFDDVAIVNICHCREEADWQEIKNIPFSTLFSFGIAHPQLPFTQTLAPYQLEKSGEQKFLLADKLSVLRTNRPRKIALWNLLKQIFV